MKYSTLATSAIVFGLFCLSIVSCNIAHSYGFPQKIGDAEATFSGNEILVKNFPHYTQGIISANQISFGNFSFYELDKFIYDVVSFSSNDEIIISIQYVEEDKYGNKTEGDKITIGKVNVSESKKYKDFQYWKNIYSSDKMFWEHIEKSKKQNSVHIYPPYPVYSNEQPSNEGNNQSSSNSINNGNSSENNKTKSLEEERIASELRWTNPVYLKTRMDEIVIDVLGQESIETGAQFNYICQESEEFYKLFNRYFELTGKNPYN